MCELSAIYAVYTTIYIYIYTEFEHVVESRFLLSTRRFRPFFNLLHLRGEFPRCAYNNRSHRRVLYTAVIVERAAVEKNEYSLKTWSRDARNRFRVEFRPRKRELGYACCVYAFSVFVIETTATICAARVVREMKNTLDAPPLLTLLWERESTEKNRRNYFVLVYRRALTGISYTCNINNGYAYKLFRDGRVYNKTLPDVSV